MLLSQRKRRRTHIALLFEFQRLKNGCFKTAVLKNKCPCYKCPSFCPGWSFSTYFCLSFTPRGGRATILNYSNNNLINCNNLLNNWWLMQNRDVYILFINNMNRENSLSNIWWRILFTSITHCVDNYTVYSVLLLVINQHVYYNKYLKEWLIENSIWFSASRRRFWNDKQSLTVSPETAVNKAALEHFIR